MATTDPSQENWQSEALQDRGPTVLVIRAWLNPVGGAARIQPAGFPEIGHVIYDAPRRDGSTEKVCIVDSAASMANHLESVCLDGPNAGLHSDLAGIPYVRCVTDHSSVPERDRQPGRVVTTSLTEGHRLASDYFLDGQVDFGWKDQEAQNGPGTGATKEKKEKAKPAGWAGIAFRDRLRVEFGLQEVKKDEKYFIWPEAWWSIYKTIFKYDPNSLIHGVMFAKEQIKVSRMLTAHLEAFGAARVGRSGVKFDRLGKTTSGQPIFAVDEETAKTVVATFILDLALLRSYGRGKDGLGEKQKRLLLDLAVWKIKRLLVSPFRYRTGCHLACGGVAWSDETARLPEAPTVTDPSALRAIPVVTGVWDSPNVTDVYYPFAALFRLNNESGAAGRSSANTENARHEEDESEDEDE